MKDKISLIIIYSLCHFIVDFVCAIFILGKLPYITNTNDILIVAIIIYNLFLPIYYICLGMDMPRWLTTFSILSYATTMRWTVYLSFSFFPVVFWSQFSDWCFQSGHKGMEYFLISKFFGTNLIKFLCFSCFLF